VSKIKKRPNIVVTIADDQRFDTISALGNSSIQTPGMDALVERGVAFTNAYHGGCTVHAVCCPSRAMLFTGRQLFGIPNVIKGWWEDGSERFETQNPDPACVPFLGELLRQNGYHCFGTGKWHNMPVSYIRNFNDGAAISYCGGNEVQKSFQKKPNSLHGKYGKTRPEAMKRGGHFNMPLYEYDATGEYNEYLCYIEPRHSTEAFTEAVVDFIDAYQGDKPFFIYCAYTAPHGPSKTYQEWHDKYPAEKIPVPANYMPSHPFDNGGLFMEKRMADGWSMDENTARRANADHYAITAHMDDGIRRIQEALGRNGYLDNTIVIHTGDHGKSEGNHGLKGKQSLYEHAAKVPLLMAGPGIPSGKTIDSLVYQHDLFPTLLEAAGIPLPEGTYYRSLQPIMENSSSSRARTYLQNSYIDSQRMIRDKQYKLIEYNVRGTRYTQLFDLMNDPDELNDLSQSIEHSETITRLRKELKSWQNRVGDPCEIFEIEN